MTQREMDLLLKLEDHVRNLGLDRDDRLCEDKQNDIRIVLDDLDLVRATVESAKKQITRTKK